MKRLLAVALILCMTSCLAEDADAAFANAAAILQESQSNSAQLVQTVKLLNDAAELYEKSGDDQKGATAWRTKGGWH